MQKLKIILQSKLFLILSLLFIIVYIFFFTKVIKYKSIYNEIDYYIIGTIVEYKFDGDKLNLTLKSDEKIIVNYYFDTINKKQYYENNVKLGLKIKVYGTLKEPSKNTIPNTFNYKKYLYNKKIYKIMDASEINFLDNDISILYRIKNKFINRIEKFKYCKEYLYAFVLGESGYISNDVYQNYKNNGVTHLFAVSGMHISFLVSFLEKILKKINLKELIINFIIIMFLVFYMFLIGFTASVVRASLLYIFLLINKKLNLKLNNTIVLYILFLILILINPFYIYDIGFIYSFLTSFGLMLFSFKITGN